MTFRHSVAFVFGFSTLFVTLGASVGAVGYVVRDHLPLIEKIAGVKHAVPIIEGQVMASSPVQALGALVRGASEAGVKSIPLLARNVVAGTLDGFDGQDGIGFYGPRAQQLGPQVGLVADT